MQTTKTPARSRRSGWLISALLTATVAYGCAATEDEAAEAIGTEQTAPKPLTEDADDDNTKAGKQDYCCAVKLGNYTENCRDMHVRKARGVLACSFGDNVLRNGKCWKYADCEPYVVVP